MPGSVTGATGRPVSGSEVRRGAERDESRGFPFESPSRPPVLYESRSSHTTAEVNNQTQRLVHGHPGYT